MGVHIGDGAVPLTDAAEEAAAGRQALETLVYGLAVLTQTCDIVRDCVQRPFIEVAPLVRMDPENCLAVRRGRRPSYASLPALEARGLVVDLDRVSIDFLMLWSWVSGGVAVQELRLTD